MFDDALEFTELLGFLFLAGLSCDRICALGLHSLQNRE